jgi:tRNA (guanosine-2'-O-)-methyltransferase
MVDLKLLAHLESFLTAKRKNRFDEVLSNRTKHITVAIEDVYQLHNTSAVMRSCEVFGIQELHIIEERNTKKIDREIALGAQKWVDVKRFISVADCIGKLRERGYQIVASTPHSYNYKLEDFDVSKKSCIFFGCETEGLSEEVLDQADTFINIPMVGFTESLNVSVSAAIVLQHLTSRLRQTNVNWKLTNEEKNLKKMEWIKKTIHSYDEIVQRFNTVK